MSEHDSLFDVDSVFDNDETTSHKTEVMHDLSQAQLDNIGIQHAKNPLRFADSYEIPPVEIHDVKPHPVKGYTRSDGVHVDGYYRDGDSGTSYKRTNPDETILNNLNQ